MREKNLEKNIYIKYFDIYIKRERERERERETERERERERVVTLFNLLLYQVSFQNIFKILTSLLSLWHIWFYAKLNSEDSINEDGLMPVHYYNGLLCSTVSPCVTD